MKIKLKLGGKEGFSIKFIPGEKAEVKEFEKIEEIPTVNPVTKSIDIIKKPVKIFKRFFGGKNIDNWRKCKSCGGFNKPSKSKFLRYVDRFCSSCGGRLQ